MLVRTTPTGRMARFVHSLGAGGAMRIGWLGALGGLAACDDRTPCERAAQIEEPALTIGVGEHRFEWALQDGDNVPTESGSQGGSHAWLAVRTSGVAPGSGRGILVEDEDAPRFVAELLDPAEALLSRVVYGGRAMRGDEEEAELALGRFVVGRSDAEQILRITAEDVCGTTVESEVAVAFGGVASLFE